MQADVLEFPAIPSLPSPRAALRSVARGLALLALALFATGCAGFATLSESMFMMSPEQEVALGQKLAPQIQKDMVLVQDPAVTSYVEALGQRIWANSQGGQIQPRFFVVKNDELNAFAIPGGNVYVYTGLLDAAENEAELSAVLGHELGHVSMRHGARHVSRQQGLDFVQQLVLGADSGQAAQLVAQIVDSGALNHMTQQDESEADAIGVQTLYRMNYDPLAMRSFFGKLKDKYGDNAGVAASFLADHPPTSARMDHVSQLAAQLPPKPFQTPPVTELRRVQGRLKQLGM
jgi:predicted Zn-dependent protease